MDRGALWTLRLSLCTVRRAQERRMAWQRAWQGHAPPRAVPRWPVCMQERPAGRAVC
jgi:hypothetical protein